MLFNTLLSQISNEKKGANLAPLKNLLSVLGRVEPHDKSRQFHLLSLTKHLPLDPVPTESHKNYAYLSLLGFLYRTPFTTMPSKTPLFNISNASDSRAIIGCP